MMGCAYPERSEIFCCNWRSDAPVLKQDAWLLSVHSQSQAAQPNILFTQP